VGVGTRPGSPLGQVRHHTWLMCWEIKGVNVGPSLCRWSPVLHSAPAPRVRTAPRVCVPPQPTLTFPHWRCDCPLDPPDGCSSMGAFTNRRDSEYEGEDINLNVTWVSSPFSWLFYVLLIGLFRAALHYYVPASVVSWELGWTITHILHGLVRAQRQKA
jgi:hypothetical protein